MKTETLEYTTVNGETLEYPAPAGELATFFGRLWAALEAPNVAPEEFTALVWSHENPLMEKNPANPDLPFLTREAFDNPAWRVMGDLIDRKRVSAGKLDLGAARARHTLDVKEAAEQLGIHTTTIRKAIEAGRLAAWKDGPVWRLDPAAVDAYQVQSRGRRAEIQEAQTGLERSEAEARRLAALGLAPGALHVIHGTDGNFRLAVKFKGAEIRALKSGEGTLGVRYTGKREGPREYVVVPGWEQVAVIRTKKAENDHRFFILEPTPRAEDGKDTGLTFAGFHVRGDFKVTRRENNSRKALEEWKGF